jgi:hypothetical protein
VIGNERIDEAKRNVKIYVEDGLLRTGDKDAARFVDFFMANAESSLRTASILPKLEALMSKRKLRRSKNSLESALKKPGGTLT